MLAQVSGSYRIVRMLVSAGAVLHFVLHYLGAFERETTRL